MEQERKDNKGLPLGNLIGIWMCIFALTTLPVFALVDIGLSMGWALTIMGLILATLVTVMMGIKINE